MPAEIVLSADALKKSYRHVQALRGVSIAARAGEITAVVGDNGSGKSTLVKLLSGSLMPDSGTISAGGQSYPGLSIAQSLALGIRTVYQDLSLDDCKDAAENIFLGCERMRGPFLDRRRMREEAAALLDSIHVRIPDITRPVRSLSGGQRQGVAIARALRDSGRILLLDEPTAAMGVRETHSTMELLRGLRERGMAQLIVSHNLAQVFSLADHIYVMRAGEIIASADTADTSAAELQELILRREEGAL